MILFLWVLICLIASCLAPVFLCFMKLTTIKTIYGIVGDLRNIDM